MARDVRQTADHRHAVQELTAEAEAVRGAHRVHPPAQVRELACPGDQITHGGRAPGGEHRSQTPPLLALSVQGKTQQITHGHGDQRDRGNGDEDPEFDVARGESDSAEREHDGRREQRTSEPAEFLGTLAEYGGSPCPAHRERTQHQQFGAECKNSPLLVPVGRVPGPEEITDRRHHGGRGHGVAHDHGTAVALLPLDRGPADGPARQTPPRRRKRADQFPLPHRTPQGSQWFDVFAAHCFLAPGGPRLSLIHI